VSSHSTSFRVAGLLCLLALLLTQPFGAKRLFVCACEHSMEVTPAAFCLAEEGGDCHSDGCDDSSSPCGRDGEDEHRHHMARDEMNPVSLAKIFVPEVSLLAVVPWLAEAMPLLPRTTARQPLELLPDDSPPAPMVRRVMVLLI
jgi:hypothetical protein